MSQAFRNISQDSISGEEYKNHKIFSTLNEMMEFYDDLSFSVSSFVTMGTSSVWNADVLLYTSLQGTLESILTVLRNGRINDAYTLLRKYHDSVVINIYSILYLGDNFSLENFVVEEIESWLKGNKKLPEYRIMSSYILNSKRLGEFNKLLYMDDRYKKIRNRCNDHTHYNFYKHVLLNNNTIHSIDRVKKLDVFLDDLEQLFILHLSYLFHLNSHYMMSSDYRDSMDLGIVPEKDSQYYVAPFIQEIFDNYIKKRRPDIASFIKSQTEMKLK